MKKRKVLGLLLSLTLVLGVVIPGTLAVSEDAADPEDNVTVASEVETVDVATDDSNADDSSTAEDKDKDSEAGEQAAAEEKTCTCGTKSDVHEKDCPLYTAPDTTESSAQSLFDKIMACTTLEEIDSILEKTSDAELAALTVEENQKIDAHIQSLEPEPAPAVEIEESTDEIVPSEIIYPTVSFTNVAPFGDPVVGGAN